MNRYSVKNSQGVLVAQYEGLSPLPHQSEWGVGYAVEVTDITAEIETRKEKAARRAELVARVKAHAVPASVNNSNQLRPILEDILELLKSDL